MRSNSPPLVPIRLEQGFAETAKHFGGIVAVKKEGADAVLSHRADAVSEDQPSGIGLDGRSAIPHLDQFPGKSRFEEQRAFVPVVDVVGEGTRTIRPRSLPFAGPIPKGSSCCWKASAIPQPHGA